MAILKSENKNTDFFMIVAWLCRFNHQELQMFDFKSKRYMIYFHPLEVVVRGSETQLQVGGNFNQTRYNA